MIFTRKLLLPRIQRKKDAKLEKFVVQNINKELKSAKSDYNLIQMQYFFEGAYYDRGKRKALISQIEKMTGHHRTNEGIPGDKSGSIY